MPDANRPKVEPDSITAGDSLYFQKDFPLYPANVWTLSYLGARHETGEQISFNATAEGNLFVVDVAPATTLNWTPGQYDLQAAVTDGTRKFTLENTQITILPNAAIDFTDNRSHARKMLDIMEAYEEGNRSHDVLNSNIEGTQIDRLSPEQWNLAKDRFKANVQKEESDERLAKGLNNKRNVYARFGPVLGPVGTFPFGLK